MADFQLKVPSMGDSITEGTVAKWLKAESEMVAVDDVVAVLDTDKVSVEVRTPVAGKLTQRCAREDDNVNVGSVLAVIDVDAQAPAGAAGSGSAPSPTRSAAAAPAAAGAPAPAAAPAPAPAAGRAPHDDVRQHRPLIQFRHGQRDVIDAQLGLDHRRAGSGHAQDSGSGSGSGAAHAAPTAASSAAAVKTTVQQHPMSAMQGRAALDAAEIEAINTGGASLL